MILSVPLSASFRRRPESMRASASVPLFRQARERRLKRRWIPAYAGMTPRGLLFKSYSRVSSKKPKNGYIDTEADVAGTHPCR